MDTDVMVARWKNHSKLSLPLCDYFYNLIRSVYPWKEYSLYIADLCTIFPSFVHALSETKLL